MKAFLLAAGEGRRLLPLTGETPKCLVPIHGTPLLAIWLRHLERQGVDAVLINTHHLADQVKAFVDGFDTSLRVECAFEKRLLGSAGTVAVHREFVGDDEDFLVLYADNLTNAPLGALVDFHRSRGGVVTLGVTETDRPREKGIVVSDARGLVLDFEEKPAEPRSSLANAGIYVASRRLYDFLPEPRALEIPFDFGLHVLPRMLGKIYAVALEGFLTDIGTPSAYEKALQEWPGL